MEEIEDNSIHLVITSPPYFDVKLYSDDLSDKNLGNIHNLDEWFEEIKKVYKEVFRVL